MDLHSQMQRIALRWLTGIVGCLPNSCARVGPSITSASCDCCGWTITVRAAPKIPARDHPLPDSRHGLPIYPNLAAGMVLTSIDQLGVADITYGIRQSIDPMQVQLKLGAASRVAPQCSSAAMSFQSAIPWRVALRQSLPPLHRLVTILNARQRFRRPSCRVKIARAGH